MYTDYLKDVAYKNLGVFIVNYVKEDPLNNIDKLAEMLLKLPIKLDEPAKMAIVNGRNAVLNDSNTRKYFDRIFKESHSNYLKGFLINLFIRAGMNSSRRENEALKIGANVPFFILIDPTEACNLRCKGCWAGKYDLDVMSFDLFDRILSEAKALGINFIVLSGGEPTKYPYLFDIAEKHRDMAFMMYTNGTLIDEKMVEKFLKTGNISPAISLEGWEKETDERRGKGTFQKIMRSMDLLKESGVPFGYSTTTTSQNYKAVFSDGFVKLMIHKGALYGWSFHYIPIGRQPDYSLMVEPEQRKWLAERVKEIRKTYPLALYDFWNDGELTEGCIAGGRRYFHITANGTVEPCAFAHIKCDNINDKPLKEVLGNKVFRAYQKYQPICDNYLRPCPIIDKPEVLQKIVQESGAVPSYEDAANILQGEGAAFLANLSARWEKLSEEMLRKDCKSE